MPDATMIVEEEDKQGTACKDEVVAGWLLAGDQMRRPTGIVPKRDGAYFTGATATAGKDNHVCRRCHFPVILQMQCENGQAVAYRKCSRRARVKNNCENNFHFECAALGRAESILVEIPLLLHENTSGSSHRCWICT